MRKDIGREEILETASRLLLNEGPAALSMRRLAGDLDCSTMVLYKYFKNKEEIIDGLFHAGVTMFERAFQRAVKHDDPLADLSAIATAYRTTARKYPGYYAVMYGVQSPIYTPDRQAIVSNKECLGILFTAVEACQTAGIFRGDLPAQHIADALWGVVHGMVSLELAGHFPNDSQAAAQRFTTAVEATAVGFFSQEYLKRMHQQ